MQLNKAIEVETMQYEKTGDLESYWGGHLKTSVKPYMACRRERGQVRREKSGNIMTVNEQFLKSF